MDLTNVLAIYNATRDDEKERDTKVEELDINYRFIEVCIELIDKRPDIAYKYLSLPKLKSVIMFIAKTENATGDNAIDAFSDLLDEYFDNPTYVASIKTNYIKFVKACMKRVNEDSHVRGEYLRILHQIGKKAGGIFTEVERDAKSYARTVIRSNSDGGEDESEEEEEEDEEESTNKDDIYEELDRNSGL